MKTKKVAMTFDLPAELTEAQINILRRTIDSAITRGARAMMQYRQRPGGNGGPVGLPIHPGGGPVEHKPRQ